MKRVSPLEMGIDGGEGYPQIPKGSAWCSSEESSVSKYIGAIDQGTTSTRFIVFDAAGKVVACAQKEHQQIYPQPGWVEHDAEEIWARTQEVMPQAMAEARLKAGDLAAIGITNQRETTRAVEQEDGQAAA